MTTYGRAPEGIYKGIGHKPWFAGKLQSDGSPAASSAGCWDGEWFETKRQATEYLNASDFERLFWHEINS